MKVRQLTFFSLSTLLVPACSQHEPTAVLNEQTMQRWSKSSGKAEDAQEAAQGTLQFSWDKPQQEVTSYKFFYTRTLKATSGGTLVGTATWNSDQQSASTQISLSKLGHIVPVGSEACFYIVAVSAEGDSEPSDPACLTL